MLLGFDEDIPGLYSTSIVLDFSSFFLSIMTPIAYTCQFSPTLNQGQTALAKNEQLKKKLY